MRQHIRDGFTLVELLVVIEVIALLMAIFLPIMNKAREQARQVVCSNNRQILLAMMMYANENKGVLPVPYMGGGGAQIGGHSPLFAIWEDDTRWASMFLWGDGQGTLWPYVGTKDPGARAQLFACPSDPDPRLFTGRGTRNYSYVFNGDLYSAFGGRAIAPIGVRLPRITGSEHKILIAESAGGFEGQEFSLDMADGINPLLPPRHSGRAFVGMADGHAELFDPGALLNPMKGPTLYYGGPITTQYVYYCLLPH